MYNYPYDNYDNSSRSYSSPQQLTPSGSSPQRQQPQRASTQPQQNVGEPSYFNVNVINNTDNSTQQRPFPPRHEYNSQPYTPSYFNPAYSPPNEYIPSQLPEQDLGSPISSRVNSTDNHSFEERNNINNVTFVANNSSDTINTSRNISTSSFSPYNSPNQSSTYLTSNPNIMASNSIATSQPPLAPPTRQRQYVVSTDPGATNPYEIYRPGDIGGLRPRMKTMKKQVALQSGNFVVDQPISQTLLSKCTFVNEPEFTHLRYTAVTCDANDYPTSYTLRQRQFKRKTKIALVITMYNEDDILFTKSVYAVLKNISYLCSKDCKHNWGIDGWKNFVVCIVSDGRSKVNPKTLTVLGMMGCYVDGLAKSKVNGEDVQAHVFEYTSQIAIDSSLSPRNDYRKFVPMQTIFLLKEKNAKKINSHRWFFNALCKVLDPEVTFLLDVGTVPTKESFYHLYRAFERDSNTAGACGEIKAELGKFGKNLINPLVAGQNFEYKMSNILDKPLESIFGYITVLPGAFSAYRYRALQGKPLNQYFLGEKMHGGNAKIFEANMYLAEDRILCFELVTKKNDKWVLKYIKDAKAETDVPDRLPELISQRRRWLNGSFFASVHAVCNFLLIFRSNHSIIRKLLLLLEFVYLLINLLFNWFAIGNFYLAFYFLFDISGAASGTDPFSPHGDIVFQVVNILFLYAIVCVFISSLGNRPQGSKFLYHCIVIMFAAIMGMMLFMGIWTVYQSVKYVVEQVRDRDVGVSRSSAFWDQLRHTSSFRDVVISIGSTYGLYLVSSLVYLDPWHIFTCMFQYMLLLPTYINVFTVYAFCNLHDVSWGTKGDNAPDLGQVNVKKTVNGKQIVEVDLPVTEDDLNIAYEAFQKQLARQREMLRQNYKEPSKVDSQQKQEDKFRSYRTNVVLLWLTMNVALIIVFTNSRIQDALRPDANASNINPYLAFIFWCVAGLSFFRFICSMTYIIFYWVLRFREFVGPRGKGMKNENSNQNYMEEVQISKSSAIGPTGITSPKLYNINNSEATLAY